MEIFKVQLPLSSNETEPPALIYNEDRSVEIFAPVSEIEEFFWGDEKKVYVYGKVHHGEIHLHTLAPEQEW